MVLETCVERIKRGLRIASNSDAKPEEHPLLDDCLESVVQWIASRYGKEYYVAPLEEFASKFGKSFPEDAFYQDRMNYFLEYCILERSLTGSASGQTPLRVFMDEPRNMQSISQESWRSFSDFRHSMFEVIKAGADQIILKDLLNDRRYAIWPKSGETLKYLEKKTIFQGYIFTGVGHAYLGHGMITHPIGARKVIFKYLKALKKTKKVSEIETMRLAALTNMRYLRMQHVNPATIYGQYFV